MTESYDLVQAAQYQMNGGAQNDVRRQGSGPMIGPNATAVTKGPSYSQMQKELDGAAGYLKRDINPNPSWNSKYRPVQDSDQIAAVMQISDTVGNSPGRSPQKMQSGRPPHQYMNIDEDSAALPQVYI